MIRISSIFHILPAEKLNRKECIPKKKKISHRSLTGNSGAETIWTTFCTEFVGSPLSLLAGGRKIIFQASAIIYLSIWRGIFTLVGLESNIDALRWWKTSALTPTVPHPSGRTVARRNLPSKLLFFNKVNQNVTRIWSDIYIAFATIKRECSCIHVLLFRVRVLPTLGLLKGPT